MGPKYVLLAGVFRKTTQRVAFLWVAYRKYYSPTIR